MDRLSRVALAVASFKNDQQVLDALSKLASDLHRFARVLVVDSIGTGALPARLKELGLDAVVTYEHRRRRHCGRCPAGPDG
jgi:hypothetical protein